MREVKFNSDEKFGFNLYPPDKKKRGDVI